jgi:hypothetical protein
MSLAKSSSNSAAIEVAFNAFLAAAKSDPVGLAFLIANADALAKDIAAATKLSDSEKLHKGISLVKAEPPHEPSMPYLEELPNYIEPLTSLEKTQEENAKKMVENILNKMGVSSVALSNDEFYQLKNMAKKQSWDNVKKAATNILEKHNKAKAKSLRPKSPPRNDLSKFTLSPPPSDSSKPRSKLFNNISEKNILNM